MDRGLKLYEEKKLEELQTKEIEENMKTLQKKRHIWIFGASNSGKTKYVQKLKRRDPKNWYKLPKNNDFKGYKKERYLWIDEFVGTKFNIETLNEICDGEFQVNTKYGSKVFREDC